MEAKQMTFGKCKVCRINEAIYSRGVCENCHKAKQKVVRQLFEEGYEPGTESFISKLKEANVYY